MGLASKVEDMKALDAEARKRELEGLVAQQAEAKQAEARRAMEQAKRCVICLLLVVGPCRSYQR